ncbi:hypothetical protein [Phytomonospora endophytica]|uniref:Uncharacterized protein n=1 Tax=Phytomonospora endophytica TaxID=714109 RepID=A0A841FXZ3_9ACTN|nr:hypothetical protein [Phytomonospora endophytica]MBB6038227.1 hypothetical protein [Phytomonospora endophytica]GIG67314.1 hypothetical protein Pen01_36090 [Phytomonospora endophytica]
MATPTIAAAYQRAAFQPADVRFAAGTGLACPMDDAPLIPTRTGWTCRTCAATWDFHGQHGTWNTLTHSRTENTR